MANKGRSIKEAKLEKIERRRRKRRRKKIFFMMLEIVCLCILLVIGYGMTKYGMIDRNIFGEGDIVTNEGIAQEGYTTIALFGGDSREGELQAGTHADTIIIAAIDNETKEIKLVSIYRDLITRQMSGELKKANNAYFQGGPKEAINMLNTNLDLDIEHFVTVDFKALADTIDLLGGIDIDVSAAEADAVNDYIGETAEVAGKEAIFLSEGMQTLDGVQAVTYARIRKNVGEDYARTERQRLVLQKVAEKATEMDLGTLNDIIDKVFPQISTSITLTDMFGLASDAMRYKLTETAGFPFEHTDGNVQGIGSVVMPLGFKENVEELHAFLYPKDEYSVSNTVLDIAKDIEVTTGYTREDYVAPDTTE